jgi:hypothetical protein
LYVVQNGGWALIRHVRVMQKIGEIWLVRRMHLWWWWWLWQWKCLLLIVVDVIFDLVENLEMVKWIWLLN